MAKQVSAIVQQRGKHSSGGELGLGLFVKRGSDCLLLAGLLLLTYGLAWTFTTHAYLKGFADAIVPLDGSPQQKTEALLGWFRNAPPRNDVQLEGSIELRNPVNIVQNEKLLKICGSASNAFLNLADVAGLRTRRLLLLDSSGGTMHVVTEVKWGEQWAVVDPQQGRVFKDQVGRPLTKEELRDPGVFQDAISRIPGYSPSYTFERTAHLHLSRLPILGKPLQRTLNRLSPGWDEAIDWAYFPENPSLWPILLSLPLLLMAILIRVCIKGYSRRLQVTTKQLHQAVSA